MVHVCNNVSVLPLPPPPPHTHPVTAAALPTLWRGGCFVSCGRSKPLSCRRRVVPAFPSSCLQQHGTTVLHHACTTGDVELVRILAADFGADVDAISRVRSGRCYGVSGLLPC